MFEKASRMKLRFDTPRGRLTVEDVWDLPLLGSDTCLDEVAKSLHRELKRDSEESFVAPTTEPNEELELKFEIVRHIIGVRLAEKQAAEDVFKRKQQKQQILAIIAKKESEALEGKGIDELRELLEGL